MASAFILVFTADGAMRAAKNVFAMQDEVLQSMQQKLDDLFDEMNSLQQQYVRCDSFISSGKEKIVLVGSKKLGDEEGARCCVCARPETAATPNKTKDFCGMDDTKSDVVDRSSLSSLAAEQELYNLQKECEEKDATIKELAAAAHASSTADAKRIAELQDILKRKNMVISKLKKDMSALKQMVAELTRAKRTSFVNLNPICSELPVMSNNVLYDMSSTSPSSSDSESPVAPREYLDEHLVDGTPGGCETKGSCRVPVEKTSVPAKKSSACKLRSTSPFKENRISLKVETSSVGRQKQLIAKSNGDFKRIRRQSQQDSRNKATRRAGRNEVGSLC